MVLAVVLSALLITVLGVAYVKGYDVVKRRSPEHLVQFYLIVAVARMLLVGTVVLIGVLAADDRDDALHFALAVMGMYAVMMITTLSMRH